MQEKDQLIRPGMTVVDLGAAPGGWSQVASELVGDGGRVVATDILPMDGIAGVDFIQGDFTEEVVLQQVLDTVGEGGIDLVISDMAPNISGMKEIDQPRSMYLAELALDLARSILDPGAYFVVKVFQGAGYPEFQRDMQSSFASVKTRKPKASRARSAEVYLLGSEFRG
jgi:23S rRNA (uridine2552-2'-O)-methyltransferase